MLFDQIKVAIKLIRSKTDFQPRFGLILGTGLGNLGREIDVEVEIPYEDIPHFPASTVESHAGKLIFGQLEGHAVVAMSGRFHYYEGYTMQQITFPVRVLKHLGIERLFVSNAAGSVNPEYEAGDLVFIRDHINLQAENPLRGKNDDRLGPRFPDMLRTYDAEMIRKAETICSEMGIRAHAGVYVALQGPNLETPAEYHFMRVIGADVVGMSTVPEVLVARHMDLPVFALSVVSNKCYPLDILTETTLEEVIQVVQAAEPKVTKVVKRLLGEGHANSHSL
jgi:purine-nucleoside phosphorylase